MHEWDQQWWCPQKCGPKYNANVLFGGQRCLGGKNI
jgi:hypothetical protein